jgi:hypothetical protein
MRNPLELALGLFFVAFTLTHDVAKANEISDKGTQSNGMHSCPLGRFVTGVHVDRNQLLCADGYGNYTAGLEIVDGDDEPPTRRDNMHSCPDGRAVTSIHVE